MLGGGFKCFPVGAPGATHCIKNVGGWGWDLHGVRACVRPSEEISRERALRGFFHNEGNRWLMVGANMMPTHLDSPASHPLAASLLPLRLAVLSLHVPLHASLLSTLSIRCSQVLLSIQGVVFARLAILLL